MTQGGRFSLCILALVLLYSCLVAAQDNPPAQGPPYAVTSFTLRDVTAARNISNLPVMFFAHNLNTREDERITQYVDGSGMFSHRLTPGNWVIEFRIFDASQDSFLYYSKNVINIQPTDRHLNKTFYLAPVGSIDGSVVGPDGGPIRDAELDFVCAASLRYDDLPSRTNSLGSFHADIIPVGVCKVYSTTNELIGSADVHIQQGERASMTIRLAKKDAPWSGLWGWAFGLLTVVLASFLIAMYILKLRVKKEIDDQISKISNGHHGAEHPTNPPVPPSAATPAASSSLQPTLTADSGSKAPVDMQTSENVNPRARDVLKTLSERESAIATLLLDSRHETTQAKIRNNLGIPKTSLARLLRTLEEKKVLHVDRIGNMKKVKLTDWFLGKN